MPETGMDYWTILGVLAAIAAVVIAFMRRPKATTNLSEGSDRVHQEGGEGSTSNVAKNSRDVRQRG